MKGYTGSKTPEIIRDLWQTPKEIFNELDEEFDFDLDVAASDSNHLCKRYFTEEDDSLVCDWGDSNYLNPPYSDPDPWIEKSIEQHKLGKNVVLLLPSDTGTKWFKKAFESANEVRFISGRIAFINANTGKEVPGNNKASVIFVWNAHCRKSYKKISLINRDDFYN